MHLQPEMTKRTAIRVLMGTLLMTMLLLSVGSALAQSPLFAVDRWIFGSGGGQQTAGGANGVVLEGTVGQAVVGDSSGGAISLSGGYWNAISSKTDPLDNALFLPCVQR